MLVSGRVTPQIVNHQNSSITNYLQTKPHVVCHKAGTGEEKQSAQKPRGGPKQIFDQQKKERMLNAREI